MVYRGFIYAVRGQDGSYPWQCRDQEGTQEASEALVILFLEPHADYPA